MTLMPVRVPSIGSMWGLLSCFFFLGKGLFALPLLGFSKSHGYFGKVY